MIVNLTLYYSPELIEADETAEKIEYNPEKSDVFALGLTLLVAATSFRKLEELHEIIKQKKMREYKKALL